MASAEPIEERRVPRPSVSKSSMATFDECERKWALSYEKSLVPKSIRNDVWFQADLMPAEAVVGQIVDDAITAAIRLFPSRRTWPENWAGGLRKIFDEYLSDSENYVKAYGSRALRPDRKRQPIDRVFFGKPYTEDERAAILADAEACVRTWIEAGFPNRFAEVPAEDWRPPPKGLPPWFMDGDVPVWAKYDFATVSQGETRIYDWKTGKYTERKRSDVAAQLHTYAAYAMAEWGATPESLRLSAVWLSAGVQCEDEIPFDPGLLQSLREAWRERHALLSERMALYEKEPARLFELFPTTGIEKGRCPRCNFHCCEGYLAIESKPPEGLAAGTRATASEDPFEDP